MSKMREELGKLFNRDSKKVVAKNFTLPDPMKLNADGVDHINIFGRPLTTLGRHMSTNSRRFAFTDECYDRFSSIENFWAFIRAEEKDDDLRRMSSVDLRNTARNYTEVFVENFKALIINAYYQRIKQNKELLDQIVKSSLPFDCYYVNKDGLRIRPGGYYKWLLAGLEEVRKAIKENREPDLTPFMDNTNSLYDVSLISKKKQILDAYEEAERERQHHEARRRQREEEVKETSSEPVIESTEAIEAV